MMLCLFGSRFEHPQYALFAVDLDEMTINQLKAELGPGGVQDGPEAGARANRRREDARAQDEEEGEQDLAREQLWGVILVLGMVPVDDVVAGRGGSVYRHCPRAHQLAFSPPLCCPASRALERLEPLPTPTSHFLEV